MIHEGVLQVVSGDSALVHPLDGVPNIGNTSCPGEPADVGESLSRGHDLNLEAA